MQIVIDVPEKLVCEGFERPFTEEEKNILIKAIGNAKPLPKERYEGCMLVNNCNYKTATCYVCEPDNGCYPYRYIKKIIEKENKSESEG
jgi:hypothetical protein